MTESTAPFWDALAEHYRFVRELGRGGMAIVYLAHDLRHERSVALKVLKPELAASLGPERFLREIKLAARLQHPHILSVHDSGEAAGRLWYTMPYVEGESLRQRLMRERQLPVESALRIARNVASALGYAHEHDIIHRDIKPENILLEGSEAVVADFGIAKAISAAAGEPRLTETGLALGTPTYMSPEQATGDQVDGRSDIYALGCVLYEMLAGEPPFTGPTAQAVIAKRLAGPLPRLRRVRAAVPEPVERVVERCLAPVPADRFASATRLAEALGAVPTGAAIALPRRRLILAAIAVGLVVAGAVAAWHRGRTAPAHLDPNVLVVLPFRTGGADPGVAHLRQGMVELLAVKLTGEGGPRAVDPSAVLSAWGQSGGSATQDLSEGAALQVARRLGAGRLVQGSVVGSAQRLVLSASVLPASGSAGRPPVSVEGPLDSLSVLVDRLTARLLAGEAGETEKLASIATPSLPALRAYLDGQAAYRRGHYEEAARHFERALQLDETFALAALGLANTGGWCCPGAADRGLRLAWAGRDRLSARDRMLLTAKVGPHFPDPSSQTEHLGAWEQAIVAVPDRPEAWYELGDVLFHWGALLGLADSRERAAAAFRRAVELDSGFLGPLQHLIELAAIDGDTATVGRLGARALAGSGTSEVADYLRWRTAIALEDSATLAGLRSRVPAMAERSLWHIKNIGQYDGIGAEDVRSAMTVLRNRAPTREARRVTAVAAFFLALNSGRPAEALGMTEELREVEGDPHSHLWLQVLGGIYWEGDTSAAASAARQLASSGDAPPGRGAAPRPRHYRDLCVLGQWRLWQGDTTAVQTAIDRLRSAAAPRDSAEVVSYSTVCGALLRAWLAETRRSPDAAPALRQLDSLMLTGPAAWRELQQANLLVSRLYEAQGDTARALAAVRRRHYFIGSPFYLSSYLPQEGRLAALTGDRAGAIRAFQHYLALRPDPERSVKPEVERVRLELARLLAEPPPP